MKEVIDDVKVDGWPEHIDRIESTVRCTICGKPIGRHYQPAVVTCSTLVVDCTGTWWKT